MVLLCLIIYTNIIIGMKKEQVKEYFSQLKQNNNKKDMTLAQLINTLTGGAVGLHRISLFIDQTLNAQNERYNHIKQYLKLSNWRLLQFDELYLILKYLKHYFRKQKTVTEPNKNSEIDLKQISSFTQKPQNKNNTLEEIMKHLNNKQELINTSATENDIYGQKWKHTKLKVVKKLLVIFQYLRKTMRSGESFQKYKMSCEKLDLNTFMKYIKIFQLGFVFKTEKIIKSFKDNAVNHMWLDFDCFVATNFQMIGFKQDLENKEKYLRLRGFSDILASQKIKKVLNLRGFSALTTIVQGNIGTYKQDIINYEREQYEAKKAKVYKRSSNYKLKTEGSQSQHKIQYQESAKVAKSNSVKNLPKRPKTLQPNKLQTQLKLPTLKLKQFRQNNIYLSLKLLDLKKQQQKMKKLLNVQEQQQYLSEYLKKQQLHKHTNNKTIKKAIQLPPMRFS